MTIDFIRAPFWVRHVTHLPQRFDRQSNLLFGVGCCQRESQRTAVDGYSWEQRGVIRIPCSQSTLQALTTSGTPPILTLTSGNRLSLSTANPNARAPATSCRVKPSRRRPMIAPSSVREILSPTRALARLAVGLGPEKTAVEAKDSRRFSSSPAQLTKAAIEENAFDMPPT